ncbi:flagellar hook-basal body protein [Herbaspirillum rubrisubalbicans]|uniref:flagellar hook-basal body protein n=1 Tax=Herbaspirillum rubrisubalbicans TaxID=80842 RepID=UPI000DC4B774|nr:flagellar hook-basal body protein [Herbaspirillum rubrisubalbicans]RAN48438.1 flagellar hook-basal body protein [Herbaspirillum rubrisubalbicans]
MQPIYAVALQGMHQDMEQMDQIARNLANVSTAGYKRAVIAEQPFVDALDDAASAGVRQGDALHSDAQILGQESQVLFDTRPGTFKKTGNALDLALDGDGFFEVETENGLAYTRQGDFHMDARGRLVTAQGYPVMGKNGAMTLTTQTPVIDASGYVTEPQATTGPSVTSPGTPLDQIKVVRFDDPKKLTRLGNGLVVQGKGMTLVADGDAHIRQGMIENANVSTLREMMQMMQTMRHFESMQKMTQGYDDMLGTAIHKLGDLS